MKHPRLIRISLIATIFPIGCIAEADDELFGKSHIEGELEETDYEDQVAVFDGIPDELVAANDPSPAHNLPGAVSHNVIYTKSFTNGGEFCSFSFRLGNYGVGYTQIKMYGGEECGSVSTVVVAANGVGYYDDSARTDAPDTWVQATAGAGYIINASYCVELHSWGSLVFSYNALNNTLESVGQHYATACGY